MSHAKPATSESFETLLPALLLVPVPGAARRLMRGLRILLVVLPLGLALIPWQQNLKGYGRVVAYIPTDREQTIEATVSGRVVHVWIIEGQKVRKGENILEISDNDPEYRTNLQRQYDNLQMKMQLAQSKVTAYADQLVAFSDARMLSISAANNQVSVAEQKVRAEEQNLEGVEAESIQSAQNLERQKLLNKEGLSSKLDFELADRKYKVESRKVEMVKSYLEGARKELAAKKNDRDKIDKEASAKIESARAQEKEAAGDVTIVQKDLLSLQVTLNRQATQIIKAPRDGTIHRLWVNQNAEQLKQGDKLFTLIPDTEQRAVELKVDGNDASLISAGREVRLQFEGWPAVQFSGWPSVAVGTFRGKVALVDATDDGKGRFRILIRPVNEEDWPSTQYLRQGVRANGWVLLNRVSLGWEIWRQLNGFPPVIADKNPDDIKPPKLPK